MAMPTAARPASRAVRKQGPLSFGIMLWRLAFGLLLFGGWELASGRLIDEAFVSRPTLIAVRIWELLLNGEAWFHLRITVLEMVYGFVLGATTGLLLGFLLGRSTYWAAVFEPYLMAFYGIPRIALAPILIIWLGIGIWSKVAIVFIQVFFLVFINTYAGMRNINEEYVLLARVMGASPTLIMRRVILPSAAPFIMLGLRSAVPYSVIGAVVGEFMAANKGIGYYINYSGATFDSAGAFAGIALLLCYITLANMFIQRVERSVIRWKKSDGAGVNV